MFAVVASATAANIPSLTWHPRSDWLNVKTHQPAAAGDGVTDDAAALQAALDAGVIGKTIYLPPGQYRITQTLVFHGPGLGCLVAGHGRETTLFWDGPVGGCMFRSDGIAYSRYIGLSWDGRNRAAVGFDHASQLRFETEVLHQHEAYRNFTAYGIRVGHAQKVASAEILYQNCLFESCGTALGFLTFNDYDNTIDRCEFRNCGVGVFSHKSNFYARNSHFEHSRETDFLIEAEHGCSIRRCTSTGSRRFVSVRGTIAPLTIQDCHVTAWTDPEAAVVLNGSPVLIFDCSFDPSTEKLKAEIRNQKSGVEGGAHGGPSRTGEARPANKPPVLSSSSAQKVLLSGNQPAALDQFIRGSARTNIYVIPWARQGGAVTNASQRFMQSSVPLEGHIFDAVRNFGAKGDGKADDTAAIQSAIDAARHQGDGAVAYLPTGRYVVSRTLTVSGSHYTFSGSGFACGLVWRGGAGAPFIHVADVEDVTLSSFMVGHHDLGPGVHGDDILVQAAPEHPLNLTLDEIYAYGMYQKSPDKHGIHFDQLGPQCVVNARHVQGNLKITDSSEARLLFRTSYEGTVSVEGAGGRGKAENRKQPSEVINQELHGPRPSEVAGTSRVEESGEQPSEIGGTISRAKARWNSPVEYASHSTGRGAREGLTGFLTRVSTVSEPALRVRDNLSAVFSDFYIEQSGQVFDLHGDAALPGGKITLQSPKIHARTNVTILQSHGYVGRVYLGQSQFYCEPAETVFKFSGAASPQLLLAGNFWYRSHPLLPTNAIPAVTLAGNSGARDSSSLTAADLSALSAALDDLRALGRLDLELPW